MGDLHSIPYSNSSSPNWDADNLGVFNADISHFIDSTPPLFSLLDSDVSTGYLQDALFEFRGLSKRRRLLLLPGVETEDSGDPIKGYWNWEQTQNNSENCSNLSQITTNFDGFSGESMNGSVQSMVCDDEVISTKLMKTTEEPISASDTFPSSIASSYNTKSMSDTQPIYSIDPSSRPSVGVDDERKKRVVYPFAVVKPGGLDGGVTLNDINERMLMPPSRPVRHPVGDFACRPLVSADGAAGLSGKAVVALTRIHTQGRGTITIIRTKG